MTTGEHSEVHGRGRLLLVWAGLALPYAFLVRRFWFVCDDAFISFRYARNWAAGDGLRYNLGDHTPVEGYSNFAWVALCAVFERLGLDPAVWAPATSTLLGALLLLGCLTALHRGLGVGLLPAALATSTLALFPPFAVWASGGLETMAFAALFFLVFERLVVRRAGPDAWLGGCAALLLSLMRVEGIGWAVVFAVLGFGTRWRAPGSGVRGLARYALLVGVGWGTWWMTRALYYDAALPNTVTVKTGTGAETLELGFAYIAMFALVFLTPLLLPLTLLGATRQRRRVVLTAALLTFGVYLYAVLIGGDFMTMGRVLASSFALQALLFGCLFERLRLAAVPLAAAAIMLGLLPGFDRHLVPKQALARYHYRLNSEDVRSEWEQWDYMRENTVEREALGRALKTHMPADASLVRGAIGVVGYYSGLFIHDTFGLVTREVALREGSNEERSPGHKKKVELAWFLGREPTLMIARSFVFTSPEPGEVTKRLRRTVKQWRRQGLEEHYAPDLIWVNAPAGERHALLLYRRIAGTNSRAAWQEWEQVLAGVE
jgi:arabinofuranosyltransferase